MKKNEVESLKQEIVKKENQSKKKRNEVKKEIEEIDILPNKENTKKEVNLPIDIEEEINSKEEVLTVKSSKRKALNKEIEKHKRKMFFVSFFLAIPICIIFLILAFGVTNKFSKKVYSNIYLKETKLSGLKLDEVKNEILKIYEEEKLEEVMTIMQGEETIGQIIAEDIDFKVNINETAAKAYNYGRSENFLKNNLKIVEALFNKVNIEYQYDYSEKKLDEVMEMIATKVKGKVINDSYVLDTKKHQLIITKGKQGKTADKEDLKVKLIASLEKQNIEPINIKEIIEEPTALDLDKVYKEVKRKPVDAVVIREKGKPPVFKREVVGYDLDVKDLKKDFENHENNGKEFIYKLKVLQPKVKYEDIAWEKYENVLGEKTTYFTASAYGRVANLDISLRTIRNKVIMPGEIFSFNKEVGPITAAAGYKPAGVFKNGTIENETGGGVCQTVSTLYNAVLYANLEIVQRRNHGLMVGYVSPSLDATIYQYSIDFKFRNNRNYPIKISTWINKGGSMGVKILGTKEDSDYQIQLTSRKLSTTPYKTIYQDDYTLPLGTSKVKIAGADGFTSEAYKTYRKNGVFVKTVTLSRDTYRPTNRIVLVGKKGNPYVDMDKEDKDEDKDKNEPVEKPKEPEITDDTLLNE